MRAVANDDDGIEWVLKHHLFLYEVDFGDDGKGRYIRLADFNKVVDKLEAALAAQGQGADERKASPEHQTEMLMARMVLNQVVVPPASSAGVPDGMVLVSREPTPEMLAIYEHIRSGSDWQAHVFRLTKRQLNRHRAAYKAMLAAASPAPSATRRRMING